MFKPQKTVTSALKIIKFKGNQFKNNKTVFTNLEKCFKNNQRLLVTLSIN